jgi:hypothetical protein
MVIGSSGETSKRTLQCRDCRQELPAMHRYDPRVCFPTIGIRASGKTHWLVSAYDLFSNHQVPPVHKVDSAANVDFDRLVPDVVRNRRSTNATRADLPSPLACYVRTSGLLGHNAALLCLFDFPGELMDMRIDVNYLRDHALRMDGFVFFLDPTQVSEGPASAGLAYQMSELYRFFEDMRISRNVKSARIDVPVAVCVSKLDMLAGDARVGVQILPWLRRLRETADQPPTLELMQQRSELLEEVFPLLFPNCNYPAFLEEHFGKRFLFFPMTPIGLNEDILAAPVGAYGGKDLRLCDPIPFGVLEPILWLLHVRGYSLLPRS